MLVCASFHKTIQIIGEIAGNHSDDGVFAMLKGCNMDPKETDQKLLLQDMSHELKRKRDKNKEADAVILQYQNQMLVQQLDAQKNETLALEEKFNELKTKQIAFDQALLDVNKAWNLLVDDLILLCIRAGDYENGILALENLEQPAGVPPSCSLEEMFLHWLLQPNKAAITVENGKKNNFEAALASRRALPLSLMTSLMEAIGNQQAKSEILASSLHEGLSAEDTIVELQRVDNSLSEELKGLRKAMDVLTLRHKCYEDEIKNLLESHTADQSEIKQLAGDLEESLAELEESRRKLVNLRVQKNVASGVHVSNLSPVNGVHSVEKPTDRPRETRELKDSLEEAKSLATSRDMELHDAYEENAVLSKQLASLQNEIKDEKYVLSSRPYIILKERVQLLKSELERYKGLTNSLQADRSNASCREKELNLKAETADASRETLCSAEARIEDLEDQLQKCTTDRNNLEIKLEEADQDSRRKDIKSEFSVMADALSKEMRIMEVQLNRFKEIACEALSLREEVHSLQDKICEKTAACKTLSDGCVANAMEIQSLKAMVEKLHKGKHELQIILDMYAQEQLDRRDVLEIKESERRACIQAEMLKSALDEHGLELRVRAANEAEAACQHRLSAAESEISDLRDKLDASQRDVLDVKEAIKVKDEEGEAYISEIETIGQAYENMQVQNRRLQQQVAERDDYNIKLVSESVKTKQAHNSLLGEKQALAKQLHQANASLDFFKIKVARCEEQIKGHLAQAAKVSQESRRLVISVDNTKVEQADAEKELKWLRVAVESSEKEIEHNKRKFEDLQKELEIERSENKMREQQVREQKAKVDQLVSESSEAAIEKLQDKVKEYKAVLKCSVCYDRPKEVVITKCYHLFCSLCIQRNLEIRHRKCPGCGTPFGQNDVKGVHI